MKVILNLVLFFLLSSPIFAQQKNDTFSIYFDLDVPELNKSGSAAIDSLFKRKQIRFDKKIQIIGYADYLAKEEYNLELSRKRANNVKSKLVQNKIDEKNILMLLGKGEVKRKDTLNNQNKGVPTDRRVDIIVLHRGESTIASRKITDTFVKMKPKKKLEVPPSSDDPNFDMNDIETGSTFILKNIYFPMGRHFPKQESNEDLEMLLHAMQDNPRFKIQIEGHVCCVTNVIDAYDLDSRQMDLSVNRARFIYEYLNARGISAQRISYIGFGRTHPIIEDEQTAEEAAVNRRVEIRVLEK